MLRTGVMDLFTREGINDLESIEKLEAKACSVARRGGLGYTLVARLEKLNQNHWKLNCKSNDTSNAVRKLSLIHI